MPRSSLSDPDVVIESKVPENAKRRRRAMHTTTSYALKSNRPG